MTHITPNKEHTMQTQYYTDARNVYEFILTNFAVQKKEMCSSALLADLDEARITRALGRLSRAHLIASEHINSERALTYQTNFDIENDADALVNGMAAFDAAFPNEAKDAKSPKQVERSRPDEGEVIYEVKRTRSTGTYVILVNWSTGDGKRRYIATCHDHNTKHAFDKRLPAEAQCHHPERWCDTCRDGNMDTKADQLDNAWAKKHLNAFGFGKYTQARAAGQKHKDAVTTARREIRNARRREQRAAKKS